MLSWAGMKAPPCLQYLISYFLWSVALHLQQYTVSSEIQSSEHSACRKRAIEDERTFPSKVKVVSIKPAVSFYILLHSYSEKRAGTSVIKQESTAEILLTTKSQLLDSVKGFQIDFKNFPAIS